MSFLREREAPSPVSEPQAAVKPSPAWLRTWSTPVLLAVLVTLLSLLGGAILGAGGDLRLASGLSYMVIVIGLYVFIGNSGIISFGHIAFMAVGAYTFAWLTVPPGFKATLIPGLPDFLMHAQMSPVPAILIAGLVAAIFAAIISWPLMRMTAVTAAISLFVVLIIVHQVANQATSITRGDLPLLGVPSWTTPARALIVAILMMFVAAWFRSSRHGLKLRTSREDEFGANAIGVSVTAERVWSLILSAFVVGMGGALVSGALGLVSTELFYIETTLATITMLVVGGMRSLTGAVIGAAAVFALRETLLQFESGVNLLGAKVTAPAGISLLGVAALGLIVLLLRPQGLTKGKELILRVGSSRRPWTWLALRD